MAGTLRSGEAGEGVVNDRSQHLLVWVGLADDHQALAGGDQELGLPDRVGGCGDLAAADGRAQRGGEAALQPGQKLREPEPLFRKLPPETAAEELARLGL